MLWGEFESNDTIVRRKVETEFGWMRRYAFKYFLERTGDFAKAEDYSHCVIEQFIERLQIRRELNLSYFKTMVRFFIYDEFRRQNRDLLFYCHHLANKNGDGLQELDFDDLMGASDLPDPEDSAFFRDLFRIFETAMTGLNPRDRKIVLMKLIGFSSKEVQKSVSLPDAGVTVNLIDVITSNFKKKCREFLGENETAIMKELE